jgi:DNA-binding Lrp family transcriptional regulator
MDELLKLLKTHANVSPENLARQLNRDVQEVRDQIDGYEQDGTICAYQAVIDEEKLDIQFVRAVIELRITPNREGGYDRIANRVSKFPEVESLFLMSGGYDLLVFVTGRNLRSVAAFVNGKLATIDGVLSTTTHFTLKTYKDRGVLMKTEEEHERLSVSP